MERQKKVVDASIVFKWFVQEEGSEKALMLREKHLKGDVILVAPELIILEVVNALKYKKKDKETLIKINEALMMMQINLIPLNQFLVEKAINASTEYDLTIYDAIYLALAQIHGTSLITEDKKLLETPNAISLGSI